MLDNKKDRLAFLLRLNLQIRQEMEQAEARVATASAFIAQVGELGLVHDKVFLGDIVLRRPY